MDKRISRYIISLLLSLLVTMPVYAQRGTAPTQQNKQKAKELAKQKKREEKLKKIEVTYPLYNGVSVGVDLAGVVGKALGSDYLSSEINASASLYERYFPTLEVGFGTTDTWSDKGIHYKTSAPYIRVGLDYNMLYYKKHGNKLLLGVRYAASSFSYDLEALSPDDPAYNGNDSNLNLGDGIWGDNVPYSHPGLKGSMQWLELCAGLRGNITKHISMGLILRFKFKMSASGSDYGDPWYVPGFGQYGSNNMGLTYSIIYKLPF